MRQQGLRHERARGRSLIPKVGITFLVPVRGISPNASAWMDPAATPVCAGLVAHLFCFSVLSTSALQPHTSPMMLPASGQGIAWHRRPSRENNSSTSIVRTLCLCIKSAWSGSGDQEHRIHACLHPPPPPTSFDTSGCEAPRVALAACLQSYLVHGLHSCSPALLHNASNKTWFWRLSRQKAMR